MNLKLSAQDRLEILKFLAEGHTASEACERWDVSLSTVKRLKLSVKPLISTNSNASTKHKEVTEPEVTETEVIETEIAKEYRVTVQNLEDFLWVLRPKLVRKALDILNGANKTSDQLKALDLLAKWTGLNLGNDERIQLQIAEEVQKRLQAELQPFMDAVLEDTIVSESAKDRLIEIAEEMRDSCEAKIKDCIETSVRNNLCEDDPTVCIINLPY